LKIETNKVLQKMTDLMKWIGNSETNTALIDPHQAELMAATFDKQVLKIGDALPACWHWAWFNAAKPHSELGRDGHPKRGGTGLLPPVELPRRMWAGGELQFVKPIIIGREIKKTSTIEKIAEKTGSTGALCIVTVLHELSDGDDICISEKQNLVFREDPKPDSPKATPPSPPEGAEISRDITPDHVTMFRYSALTFNGHRIHYDVDYARDVESYDGLVFHAPLTATLLMELASEIAGKAISSFKYRATSPLFGHETFSIHGKQDGDTIMVWAQTPSGEQAMIGEAH
jgi:3-methylfumaryl-CoA hydratase